jgi:hypothetical protein
LVSNDRKLKQKIKSNYIRRKLLTEALVNAVWMNLYVNGKLTIWELTYLCATNSEIRSAHNDELNNMYNGMVKDISDSIYNVKGVGESINVVKGINNSIYNFFH